MTAMRATLPLPTLLGAAIHEAAVCCKLGMRIEPQQYICDELLQPATESWFRSFSPKVVLVGPTHRWPHRQRDSSLTGTHSLSHPAQNRVIMVKVSPGLHSRCLKALQVNGHVQSFQ